MLLNEMFLSFQGEGDSVGRLAIFIRLQGCNLNCSWCDTKYTWHPDHAVKFQKIEPVELKKKIKKYDCKHIIFTGGEPTLQQEQVFKLMQMLDGYTFEIETNGTRKMPGEMAGMFEKINVSPKLLSSGTHKGQAYNAETLQFLSKFPNSIFKFVIQNDADINQILRDFMFLKPEQVWLMPQGETRELQIENSSFVLDRCKTYGFNFSPRVHTLLYNNKRGV